MPLDQQGFEIETKPDLSKPSLEALGYMLRRLSDYVPNHAYRHETYYEEHSCGTAGCALGVAHILWPDHVPDPELAHDPWEMADNIFGPTTYRDIFRSDAYDDPDPTPGMVADAIDRYLASRSAG